MEYATSYDVGDRKRDRGINEDSVAITVFEQGHRDGFRGQDRPVRQERDRSGDDGSTGVRPADSAGDPDREGAGPGAADGDAGEDAEDDADKDADDDVDAETVPDTDAAGDSSAAGDSDAAGDSEGESRAADPTGQGGDGDDGLVRGTESASEVGDPSPGWTDATPARDAGGSASADGVEDVEGPPSDDAAGDAERPPSAPANRSVAVFALADGAGGYEAGDAASYLATTTVCEELASVAVGAARSDPTAFDVAVDEPLDRGPSAADLESAVAAAIVTAHREVIRYAAASGKQAHTTIVAGVAVGGRLHYGWVGDSRAYLVNERRETITQITRDHAVVEALSAAGELDDVEARVHPRGNEITRALGGSGRADPETATVDVDTNTVDVYAEDVLLLTSDGLVDAQTDAPQLYDRYVDADRTDAAADHVRERVVTDGEIRDRVLAADSLDGAAADLVGLANDRGGKDNVSTLLARDRALDPTPEDPPDRSAGAAAPLEERQTTLGDER